jgi:elongation factor Ts
MAIDWSDPIRRPRNRSGSNGIVEAYVHWGHRFGALVEVGCETDFVARAAEFRALAHDIAMQVAAMNPTRIRADDPAGPEGDDVPLLQQPFIKDQSRTIQDLLNAAVAQFQERVEIRRFARFEVG